MSYILCIKTYSKFQWKLKTFLQISYNNFWCLPHIIINFFIGYLTLSLIIIFCSFSHSLVCKFSQHFSTIFLSIFANLFWFDGLTLKRLIFRCFTTGISAVSLPFYPPLSVSFVRFVCAFAFVFSLLLFLVFILALIFNSI